MSEVKNRSTTVMTTGNPEQEVFRAGELLEELRSRIPLTYCLTNTVVIGYTANALLAIGAAPAMIHDPDEAKQFGGIADGVLVNVGTVTVPQSEAMRSAVAAANGAGKPWVLDPVAVGALSLRTGLANELKMNRPAIIRGNASEIIALAGEGATGRGVDSTAAVEAAEAAARSLALETGAAVLVTGPVDLVIAPTGERVLSIRNGHPLMTRVTGVGCAQGAIAAALAAVSSGDFTAAAAAAALIMAVAGDMAFERASSPGSYQIALLDALDAVDAAALTARAKVGR